MKNNLKRISTMALVTMIASGSLMTSRVHADAIESDAIKGRVVVSLGANLNENQKQTMLNFFNAPENAEYITVNNEEEYKYLGNVYNKAQIGSKTFSCGLMEFTEPGNGINVKTSNLTVLTPASLSSIMTTVGIQDANLIASSPIKASGTGIAAGIYKMVEETTGTELDKDKVDVSLEEVKVSEEIASNNNITMEESNLIMNTIKDNVIQGDLNVNNIGEVKQEINNVTNNFNINIDDSAVNALAELMQKFGNLEYTETEKKAMSRNLGDINEGLEDKLIADGIIEQGFFDSIGRWFGGIWSNITGIFESKKDMGILANTNDGALGSGAIIDSTDKDSINVITNEAGEIVTGEQAQEVVKDGMNWLQKAWDWICGLFGNSALDKLPEVEENADLYIDEEDLNSEEETVIPEEETVTPEGLENTLTPEQKEEMDNAAGSDLAPDLQPESNPAPQE